MVKIRLRRTGAKKQPSYRVVIVDSRSPRDGRFIEIIGHYNPTVNPTSVEIHEDRALYWLSVGAQPTHPVRRLLQNLGTLDKFAQLKEGADLEELLAEATASSATSPQESESEVSEPEATEEAQPVEEADVVASPEDA